MKKSILYMLSVLLVGLVSCDEDFNKDVAPPQSNDPGTVRDLNFQVALASDVTSPVNLQGLDPESTLEMITVTSGSSLEEGESLYYGLEIAKTESLENAIELPTTADDQSAVVTVADLDEAIKSLFGKAPNANQVYIRPYVYVQRGTSGVCLTANTVGPVTVTPSAPEIEEAYYIIGNMNDWSYDELIQFNHSGGDVYTDPVFALTVEVPANCYFKIVPQSAKDLGADNFWDGKILGTAIDGDTSLSGELINENAQAIQIEEAGFVRITLNMEEYTYTIEPMDVNPFLYVPGDYQGWDPATASQLYTTHMDLIYTGHLYLDGGYKLTTAPNWNDTDYGDGGDGKLDANGGNLEAAAGFYYMVVNLNTMTYSLTATTWGLIGDATTGGWDNSTPMTYHVADNTWRVTTDLAIGSFKFRANNSWDINVGGSASKLVVDGDNLPVTSAGNYTIVLKLTNDDSSSCTITKINTTD
ncbi:MAG: SusF/SusE family outer membrane protein [Tannerellaceae bacterium]|nr:SusF/SusE family outer membrane protein [Tannerellaceae bacterium]